MGTTGGDRAKLVRLNARSCVCLVLTYQIPQEAEVLQARTYAVIAPQMGKQLVAFQASRCRIHPAVARFDGFATRRRLPSS